MSIPDPTSIFHAFGETARRALFFARWSLTELGGGAIDDGHLLYGVLHGSPEAVTRFADPAWTHDRLRQRIRDLSPGEPRRPTFREVPFSPSAQAVLLGTGMRPRTEGRPIVPEHIVWALMADPSTPAAALLGEAGVTREAIAAFLDQP